MSAAAVTIPVTIEDDLARLTIRTNTGTIADSLQRLNSAISTNARVLTMLCDEVQNLRSNVEMANTRNLRRFTQIEEAHEALANDVTQNISVALRTVQNKCAWKSDVQDEFKTLSGRVGHCEEFIHEIESGGGERVQRFVRSYVEGYVPKWYETVSGPLWVRVTGAITKACDDTGKKAAGNLLLAEQRSQGLVEALRAEHANRMTDIRNAQVTELATFSTETRDSFKNASRALADVARDIRSEIASNLHATHERFTAIETAAHALRAVLCLEEEKCHDLMAACLSSVLGGDVANMAVTSLEESTDVGPTTKPPFSGDANKSSEAKGPSTDSTLKPKPPAPSAGKQSKPDQPRAVPRSSSFGVLPASAKPERSESFRQLKARTAASPPPQANNTTTTTSPLQKGKLQTPSSTALPPASPSQASDSAALTLRRRLGEDLSTFLPVPVPGSKEKLAPDVDSIPLGRIMSDARVLYWLRTPQFAALRTCIQDEMEARVERLQREIRDDLAAQLNDLQAEVKTKVNTKRLAEFLQENRDETLYSNVRNLLVDVNEVKQHSVTTTQFHEVLRQKADAKTLELKADKTSVLAAGIQTAARLEGVEHSTAKLQERLMDTELKHSELVYWLHTGKTAMEGARSVSTHMHSDLLKMRPGKNGMVLREFVPPSSIVVADSKRDLPPDLMEYSGYGAGENSQQRSARLVPAIEAPPDDELVAIASGRGSTDGGDREQQPVSPTARKSPPVPPRGAAAAQALATPTTTTPMRHPHHPQKRTSSGIPKRDHLPAPSFGLGGHHVPSNGEQATTGAVVALTAAQQEYVKAIGSEVLPPSFTLKGGSASTANAPTKSTREIPDGPSPSSHLPSPRRAKKASTAPKPATSSAPVSNSSAKPTEHAIEWTAETSGNTARSNAADTTPAPQSARPTDRPKPALAQRDTIAQAPPPSSRLSFAPVDYTLSASSPTTASPTSAAVASAPTGREQLSKLLGTNVKTVLLATNAATLEDLQRTDPLLEGRVTAPEAGAAQTRSLSIGSASPWAVGPSPAD